MGNRTTRDRPRQKFEIQFLGVFRKPENRRLAEKKSQDLQTNNPRSRIRPKSQFLKESSESNTTPKELWPQSYQTMNFSKRVNDPRGALATKLPNSECLKERYERKTIPKGALATKLLNSEFLKESYERKTIPKELSP